MERLSSSEYVEENPDRDIIVDYCSPSIQEQTMAAKKALDKLIEQQTNQKIKVAACNLSQHIQDLQQTENPHYCKELKAVLEKTRELLKSPSPETLKAYQLQAKKLSGQPRRSLQILGALMIVLGLAVVAAGVLLTVGTLGVTSPEGMAVAAAGGVGRGGARAPLGGRGLAAARARPLPG